MDCSSGEGHVTSVSRGTGPFSQQGLYKRQWVILYRDVVAPPWKLLPSGSSSGAMPRLWWAIVKACSTLSLGCLDQLARRSTKPGSIDLITARNASPLLQLFPKSCTSTPNLQSKWHACKYESFHIIWGSHKGKCACWSHTGTHSNIAHTLHTDLLTTTFLLHGYLLIKQCSESLTFVWPPIFVTFSWAGLWLFVFADKWQIMCWSQTDFLKCTKVWLSFIFHLMPSVAHTHSTGTHHKSFNIFMNLMVNQFYSENDFLF